jgi:dihydroflavonol-4-reductase
MSKDAWAAVHRTNVEGTRVLLEAAREAGVPRFVFTSSGSTLGKPLDKTSGPIVTIDEDSAYNFAELGWVYPHTKWLAEELVLAANDARCSTVVTHPTAIFGPWDWKHNLLPLFRAPHSALGLVSTGGARTVCDVRDVADGHLRAALHGRGGERYALAGEPVTVRALQTLIAEAVHGRAPMVELPPGLVHGVGRLADAVGTLRGKPALFSSEMAVQSALRVVVSSEKAIRELGYHCRPARESIADTAAWYVSEGLLPAR